MSQGALKVIGVACILVVLGALFVAVDQYRTNAAKFRAMNHILLAGGEKLEPSTPTATKYAVVVAVLASVGGAMSLYAAFAKGPAANAR